MREVDGGQGPRGEHVPRPGGLAQVGVGQGDDLMQVHEHPEVEREQRVSNGIFVPWALQRLTNKSTIIYLGRQHLIMLVLSSI